MISRLTFEDIDAAMCLVEQAGWNQTAADWRRLIAYQPWGCFQAQMAGQLVGTVTSTSYGQELAWIGMMLVHPDMRRQGIGRALMQHVIAALEQAKVQTIKLDATPLGRPLYEQLGFVAQFDFQRWRRAERPVDPDRRELTELRSDVMGLQESHFALDREAFGVDRRPWLEQLAAASGCMTDVHGFAMLRGGRIADYLGPVVATGLDSVKPLMARLVSTTSSAIFWDIPQADPAVCQLARSLGFEPVRVLTRMVLGCDCTQPNLQMQVGIADPGTG